MTSEWTRTILFALILAHYRGGTIDFKNVSKKYKESPLPKIIEGVEPPEVFHASYRHNPQWINDIAMNYRDFI